MLGNDRADVVEDLFQAQRKCLVVEQLQRTVEDVMHGADRIRVDNADTRALRARVDAEDAGHVGRVAPDCRRRR
jgi:hypothetical protein